MAEKLVGNLEKGLVFVLSAPAGTGKTTLVDMLKSEFPNVIQNVSFTTRKCRPNEIPGKHYHFISKEEFEKKIADEDMLEYVTLYNCYYGSSLKSIQSLQQQGKHVFLVIDTQGAMQLMGRYPAVFIFIKPPSLDVLRSRLVSRNTEDSKAIEERLNWAKQEIEAGEHYDYVIVNDDLDTAYQVLRSIIIAEEHRTKV